MGSLNQKFLSVVIGGVFLLGGSLLVSRIDPTDLPRPRPEKHLQPYLVTLPPQAKTDLTRIIWFTIENGAAGNLSRKDFYHCHTLLTKEVRASKYEGGKYHGSLSDWIHGVIRDSAGWLCHAQELTGQGLEIEKRNTTMLTGGAPRIVPVTALAPKEIEQGTYTAWPSDVGDSFVDGVLVYFDPDPNGSLILPNGVTLLVSVENPELYTIGQSPLALTVDLP